MADFDLVVAQRASTYRFDLLDRELNEIGRLEVSSGRSPRIENNTNRTIKRTLTGMELHPSQAVDINPMSDRVRVSMVLPDGEIHPLGVFMFAGYDRARLSGRLVASPAMHDQLVVLDQPVPRSVSNPPGVYVADAIERLLAEVPLPGGVQIEASDARVSTNSAMTWPAGTSRHKILNETASVAGFYSGYFDHFGVLHYRSPGPAGPDDKADLHYRTDMGPSRILEHTFVISDDQLDAPNRYIVVDAGATEVPVVGVFDVPDEAPESAVNRGYVVARSYDVQGVGTVAQAEAAARARYAASRSYEWVTFDSPADPRHDTFQTVDVEGTIYRETGWSLVLDPLGAMRHNLRRTYGA